MTPSINEGIMKGSVSTADALDTLTMSVVIVSIVPTTHPTSPTAVHRVIILRQTVKPVATPFNPLMRTPSLSLPQRNSVVRSLLLRNRETRSQLLGVCTGWWLH